MNLGGPGPAWGNLGGPARGSLSFPGWGQKIQTYTFESRRWLLKVNPVKCLLICFTKETFVGCYESWFPAYTFKST